MFDHAIYRLTTASSVDVLRDSSDLTDASTPVTRPLFGDLILTFHPDVDPASPPITEGALREHGISPEELHPIAEKNTLHDPQKTKLDRHEGVHMLSGEGVTASIANNTIGNTLEIQLGSSPLIAAFASQNFVAFARTDDLDAVERIREFIEDFDFGKANALSRHLYLWERNNWQVYTPPERDEQKDVRFLFRQAYKYQKGKGVPQDYARALSLYRQAADLANSKENMFSNGSAARCNLADMYELGQGVTQDYGQALYWYMKSAEQENPVAQYSLGKMYRDGRGVPQDRDQAHAWFAKSAAHGHEGAIFELKELQRYAVCAWNAQFSSDGSRIVTTGLCVRVWDAVAGTLLLALASNKIKGGPASFSQDSTKIFWAGNDGAALRDARTGALLHALHDSRARGAALSSDGSKVVTYSRDKTAKVWDITTGTLLRTLTGHHSELYCAAFSKDDSMIATTSLDRTARLWDASTGNLLHTLARHPAGVTHAAFSQDGTKLVTAGMDSTAKIWDVAKGKLLHTLALHPKMSHRAIFSADGSRIVTTSWEKTAELWDAATGRLLHAFVGHTDAVNSATFSPDGNCVVTTSVDCTAKLWDTTTGHLLLTLIGHTLRVNRAAFSPDGKQIVTAGNDSVKVWDAVTGRLILTLVETIPSHRKTVKE